MLQPNLLFGLIVFLILTPRFPIRTSSHSYHEAIRQTIAFAIISGKAGQPKTERVNLGTIGLYAVPESAWSLVLVRAPAFFPEACASSDLPQGLSIYTIHLFLPVVDPFSWLGALSGKLPLQSPCASFFVFSINPLKSLIPSPFILLSLLILCILSHSFLLS